MNKKIYKIIMIVIISIIAILLGLYNIYSGYIFNKQTGLKDNKTELIEHIKNIEDIEEKKRQIEFSLEHNLISNNEAIELNVEDTTY